MEKRFLSHNHHANTPEKETLVKEDHRIKKDIYVRMSPDEFDLFKRYVKTGYFELKTGNRAYLNFAKAITKLYTRLLKGKLISNIKVE